MFSPPFVSSKTHFLEGSADMSVNEPTLPLSQLPLSRTARHADLTSAGNELNLLTTDHTALILRPEEDRYQLSGTCGRLLRRTEDRQERPWSRNLTAA